MLGNAQFFGTFGRQGYLAPISFPQTPIYSPVVPLQNRANFDYQKNVVFNAHRANAQFATAQSTNAQLAYAQLNKAQLIGAQISRGSELFSFEMFYVS